MLKVVVTKAMRQSLGLALKRMMRHSSSKVELAIDCHTHMYTPKYMNILRKRNIIPRVIMVGDENRLLILPGEEKEATTSVGRKIGKEVYSMLLFV